VEAPGVAADKKGAKEQGRSIVFIDESGFMLEPLVRRTWAPSGARPVVRTWHKHDRLSVASALTVSAERGRAGLVFQISRHNFKGEDLYRFVQSVRRSVGQKVVLVWDRWQGHRSAAKKLRERLGEKVQVEWLPVCAPELNPVEQVWSHTKYGELANYAPDDLDELEDTLGQRLSHKRSMQQLLKGFFAAAELPLDESHLKDKEG